ncbi:MAG TPA: BON domain-containing protein [Bryobacteraceae bacterium]|nr:BON domain-containing protein [Bryobacteraceae bacterium]
MTIRTLLVGAMLTASIGYSQVAPAADAAQTRIAREVRHEILMLPYFGVLDNIAYNIQGSTVTLVGQVTRPTLKDDAERNVKDIEGVEAVRNQIEVLPLSPNDDRLRIALYRAIYNYGALQRYAMPVIKPIRIVVRNGNVTLEGAVDSEGDKNLINVRAHGVSGVFRITNNLRVEK